LISINIPPHSTKSSLNYKSGNVPSTSVSVISVINQPPPPPLPMLVYGFAIGYLLSAVLVTLMTLANFGDAAFLVERHQPTLL